MESTECFYFGPLGCIAECAFGLCELARALFVCRVLKGTRSDGGLLGQAKEVREAGECGSGLRPVVWRSRTS